MPTLRGLLQDSILAPFFFNVFVDDLDTEDGEASAPLFADDVEQLGRNNDEMKRLPDIGHNVP